MLEKLQQLLRDLGLSTTLAVVVVAVVQYLGLPLEQAFGFFGVLVGLPFIWGYIVDMLKAVGVVKPGTSGQWSAAFNLISVFALAVLLKYLPDFDVTTWDAQLFEVAKSVVLVIAWIGQLFGTKGAHRIYVRTLGARHFGFV